MKRTISVVSLAQFSFVAVSLVLIFFVALGETRSHAQKPRKIPQAEVQAYLEQELIKADDRAQRDHDEIALKNEQIGALQRQLDDLRKKIRTAQNALR